MSRFDPRLHLAAAIGWAVFAIVALAALAAATLSSCNWPNAAPVPIPSNCSRSSPPDPPRPGKESGDATFHGGPPRRRWGLQLSGADALRRHLEALQAQFPEFVWPRRGRPVRAGGGRHRRPPARRDGGATGRFQQGRRRAFLGETPKALPLAKKPLPAPSGQPPRFIVVAAPITHATSRNVGVLGACLSWDGSNGCKPNCCAR